MMNTKTETFNGVYIGEGKVCERDRERGVHSLKWRRKKTKHIPCTLPLFPYGTADDELFTVSW